MADISKITLLNGTTYDLKDAVARYHLPYGECETERADAAKIVSIDGITELTAGLTIAIKFTNSNTGSNPTLNVNNLGAKSIMRTGELPAGTANETTGWDNGSIVILVYDGSAWLFNKGYNSNTTYAVSNVDCISSGLTANKVSTNAAHYVLKTGNIFEFTLLVANTVKSNLTLNINNTGAKPIYINGAASSSSNYTLPAGKYLVRYDGTAYQFRTDGKAPIDIQGTVNGYSINKSVPSTAKLTDTTYTADTSKLVTTTVPNVTSVGSAPTLGTAIPADDITSWTTNTPTAFSVTGEKLSITSGTAASLSYTAKSIPNVTSVGSAPILGAAITVATGSLASDGSGGTVATGITAS